MISIYNYYSLIQNNLTGFASVLSQDGSLILGGNSTSLYIYVACSSINKCLECDSAVNCTLCITGYFVNPQSLCSLCTPNCMACEVSASNCTQCFDTFYLSSGNTCLPCLNGCKSCLSSPSICDSCVDGLYFSTGSCLPCLGNCSTCTDGSVCVTCA